MEPKDAFCAPRKRYVTTREAAELLCVLPDTLRRSLCVRGHYQGIRPVKLGNKRLLWPAQDLAAMLAGCDQAGPEN